MVGSHAPVGQSDCAVHRTHFPLTTSQRGVAPEHCVSLVHCTHRPAATSHVRSSDWAIQSLLVVHATQRSRVVSQRVLATRQVPFDWHGVKQTCAVGSHVSFDGQSLATPHETHM